MNLTYLQMQNQVIADGLAESDRTIIKFALNVRNEWLFDADEWVWRKAEAAVTFTNGSRVVGGAPADLRMVIAMFDGQGNQLEAVADNRLFLDQFNENIQQGSGSPSAFTVIGTTLVVGPNGDGTSGLLLYERERTDLVNDGDTTGLPATYDMALVHGAKAEVFKLKKIPVWQEHEDEFAASVAALQRNYLTSVRGQVGQFGAYRPGQPVY